MHRVDRQIEAIHFAYDHDNIYIRLDFDNRKNIELADGLKCRLTLFTPDPKTVLLELGKPRKGEKTPGPVRHALDEVLEIAIDRTFAFDGGSGTLGFTVALMDNDTEVESWPETDAITVEIPDWGEEMFWPE